MELVKPSIRYKASYERAIPEYRADSEPFRFDLDLAERDFETYVRQLNEHALGLHMPEGHVPETIYWLVEGDEYVGHVSIRHMLTEYLLLIGGHIGYGIRPSMRKRGYGKAQLRLALPKVKELGISRALVTCDVTNIGSRKIIEANGGVFENQVPNPDTGVDKLRFWIDLS